MRVPLVPLTVKRVCDSHVNGTREGRELRRCSWALTGSPRLSRSLCPVPQQQQLPAGLSGHAHGACAARGLGQHRKATRGHSCPRGRPQLHCSQPAGNKNRNRIGKSKHVSPPSRGHAPPDPPLLPRLTVWALQTLEVLGQPLPRDEPWRSLYLVLPHLSGSPTVVSFYQLAVGVTLKVPLLQTGS